MQPNHQARGVTRALLGILVASSLAACADDEPIAPTAKIPEGGVQSLAPNFDLLPTGQTFTKRVAFVTGSPNGKAAYVQVYDKDGGQLIRMSRTELHELLAQAWDAAHGRDSAAAHYRVVADSWEHADALLQTRRARAAARLAAPTS